MMDDLQCGNYSNNSILICWLAVMSFEEKQIHKLSRQLMAKEQEHKREKSIMIQKIELLQSQIMDFQEKDMKNRQLNESIMMSYKQNQSFREQCKDKELTTIMQRHQEQIKSLKKRHSEQKKRLEDQVNNLKCENDRLKLDIQRMQLEHEKQITEVKNSYEERLNEKNSDMNNIFHHKFELINERLRQSEEMNAFFKNQLQPKKERALSTNEKIYVNIEDIEQKCIQFEKQNRRPSIGKKKNTDHYEILKKNQSTISSINLRINRALVQLNPNKAKLNDRIKKIRERIYEE